MTEHDPKKLRQLLGYIGLVRDELRMQGWDIILFPTPHDKGDDVWAHTWQSDNHQVTCIELSPDFFDDPRPVTIRNVVVHELTHAQHRDVSYTWESCTLHNSDIPVSQSQSWDKDFRLFQERFVSWITQMIEPRIPLWEPEARYRIRPGCYLRGEQP